MQNCLFGVWYGFVSFSLFILFIFFNNIKFYDVKLVEMSKYIIIFNMSLLFFLNKKKISYLIKKAKMMIKYYIETKTSFKER